MIVNPGLVDTTEGTEFYGSGISVSPIDPDSYLLESGKNFSDIRMGLRVPYGGAVREGKYLLDYSRWEGLNTCFGNFEQGLYDVATEAESHGKLRWGFSLSATGGVRPNFCVMAPAKPGKGFALMDTVPERLDILNKHVSIELALGVSSRARKITAQSRDLPFQSHDQFI